MALPYTAFIKAPVGSRVVIKQQKRKVLYNQVMKNKIVIWKTNVLKHWLDTNLPVYTDAKLPHHKTSKVVKTRFVGYLGY